jgi:hypothetical protein
MHQSTRRGRHFFDGRVKGGLISARRLRGSTELPNKLERRRANLVVGRGGLEIRERFNISAHRSDPPWIAISSVHFPHDAFDFFHVPGNLDLGKDAGDSALPVEDDGRPLDSHVVASVQRFLLPDSEGFGEPVILVDEKLVRQFVLLLELAMRVDVIGTHTHHHCIDLPEPGKGVAKRARFLGSAGGIVFRVEEKYRLLSLQRIARDDTAVVSLKGEIGRRITFTYHGLLLAV